MNPQDSEEPLSGDELLKRSRELREHFSILTRVLEGAGFPVGDAALATAGLSRPRLHQLYTAEDGVAAFAEGPADWACDGQFALLPARVLGFFTLADPATGPFIDDPKRVHWRPGRPDYDPEDDEQPWFPRAVRDPLGPDGHPHREYALFLRRAGDDRYLYAGPAGLGGWTNPHCPVADFYLRERLLQDAWERLGGWSGWWGGIGTRKVQLAPDDVAGFEQLLADLGPHESIYLTRYEGDALSVSLTTDRGHVRYSELDGRDTRVARDPAVPADSPVEVEFPGEQDSWSVPLRETLPRAEAVAAAVEFVRTGQPPACVGEPSPPPPPPPPPTGSQVGLHTEPEWFAEQNPERLLISIGPSRISDLFDRLGGRSRPARPMLSDRKLWLLAVACCRRVWHLMTDERTRRVVEVVERWADGGATDDERAAAGADAHQAWADTSNYYWGRDEAADAAHRALHSTTTAGAELGRGADGYQPGMQASAVASSILIETARAVEPDYQNSPERPAQADLMRCLAGNPFRPITFAPAWRTGTVASLAVGIYEERAFDRLPILADALQDAGCDNNDILQHCRGGGPHCRGCWVVDLVLGKE